jgi:hypothetical protein
MLPHHVRNHVRFVRLQWSALEPYLRRRFDLLGAEILEEAHRRARISLRSVSRFLRRNGVHNVHRFLAPMRINQIVDDAISEWEMDFHAHWTKIL